MRVPARFISALVAGFVLICSLDSFAQQCQSVAGKWHEICDLCGSADWSLQQDGAGDITGTFTDGVDRDYTGCLQLGGHFNGDGTFLITLTGINACTGFYAEQQGSLNAPSCDSGQGTYRRWKNGIGGQEDDYTFTWTGGEPQLSLAVSSDNQPPFIPGNQTLGPLQYIELDATIRQGAVPTVGATVNFSVNVSDIESAGHHNHAASLLPFRLTDDNDVPNTSCATDATGTCHIDLDIPQVSGTFTVTASTQLSDGAHLEKTHDITIRLPGLEPLAPIVPFAISWAPPVSADPNHQDYLWGQQRLIEAANCIAQEFYTISGGYRLSFNDMSLPWGGMFDNNSRFFVIPNSPGNSHAFHRRGTGMDVNTTATKDAGGTITIGPTHPFVITVAAACNTWLIPEPQIHFELIGPAFGF